MAAHDIIAVGASAGGVEALMHFVSGLPADLPAAVMVVLHVPPHITSHLPAILARYGQLPATHAQDGEAIVGGRIYIAPPDHHMIIRADHVALTRGPHENRSRPAIDPLFRSAARVYGARTVGVVLSGTLGDGALGLQAIEIRGGVPIVQEPAEALFPGMPSAALRAVQGAYVLPVAQIAALVAQIARESVQASALNERGELEVKETEDRDAEASLLARRDIQAQAKGQRNEETTIYTCPECGGTLWQLNRGDLTQYSCHVGHSYGAEALLGQMSEELEAALWRCVRLLVEKATLTRQFAQQLRTAGHDMRAQRIEDQANSDDHHGQLIRDLLLDGLTTPTAQALVVDKIMDPVAASPIEALSDSH